MVVITPHRRAQHIVASACMLSFLITVATAHAQETPGTSFAPGASEQMKNLSWLIGDWVVVSRMIGPGGEDMSMPDTTSTIESVLDGCMLKESMDMKGAGFTMKMTGFRSYDSFRNVYRDVWFDNVMGLADVYEGAMDADGVITMSNVPTAVRVLAMGHGLVHVRKKQTKISEDEFVIAFEISKDEGKTWTKTGTATYTRKSPQTP